MFQNVYFNEFNVWDPLMYFYIFELWILNALSKMHICITGSGNSMKSVKP